jgi:hypothetical protein
MNYITMREENERFLCWRLRGRLRDMAHSGFQGAFFRQLRTPKRRLCARLHIPANRDVNASISRHLCGQTNKPTATGELICTN